VAGTLRFISDEAVLWIAEKLGLQPINILELVTFYPMFRQKPAGKLIFASAAHSVAGWSAASS